MGVSLSEVFIQLEIYRSSMSRRVGLFDYRTYGAKIPHVVRDFEIGQCDVVFASESSDEARKFYENLLIEKEMNFFLRLIGSLNEEDKIKILERIENGKS
jgi:hypothetical protein